MGKKTENEKNFRKSFHETSPLGWQISPWVCRANGGDLTIYFFFTRRRIMVGTIAVPKHIHIVKKEEVSLFSSRLHSPAGELYPGTMEVLPDPGMLLDPPGVGLTLPPVVLPLQTLGEPEQVKPDSIVQVAEQPSPGVVFPSSQASLPSMIPSPQVGV
jgi:hypothetical protein